MEQMNILPQLLGIIIEEEHQLSLAEISRACSVHAERIIELVEEGIILPAEKDPHRWRFSGEQMRHARIAFRLQRDLGLNLSGAALVLELLEEVETLRTKIRVLEGG